jgi:hypothetical protein
MVSAMNEIDSETWARSAIQLATDEIRALNGIGAPEQEVRRQQVIAVKRVTIHLLRQFLPAVPRNDDHGARTHGRPDGRRAPHCRTERGLRTAAWRSEGWPESMTAPGAVGPKEEEMADKTGSSGSDGGRHDDKSQHDGHKSGKPGPTSDPSKGSGKHGKP